MGNSKRLALAFLFGALLVGGVLGFTTARVMGGRNTYLERPSMNQLLANDLHLTPEQRMQLDSILDRRHRDMSAIMDPVRPQLDSVRERARNEMRRMMTPEQRAAFEQILQQQEAQRAKEGKR
jgi:Spy/CpxP family protein refolding chaperone